MSLFTNYNNEALLWGNAYYIKHCRTEYVGDSFLGIDLAMSHSLEGRVGDTAPVCRLLARRTPLTVLRFSRNILC